MSDQMNLADELLASMQEALAHARGERTDVRVTEVPAPAVRVRAVRKRLRLAQADFATLLGVSVSGLRKWEQGVRQPSGAALTLLTVMDREPEAVARAIADAGVAAPH